MSTLTEIREEQQHYSQLIEELKNSDDELTPEQEEQLRILLECQEETEEAEAAKIQRIVELCKHWQHWAKIREDESKRLKALADADYNRAKSLQNLIFYHLKSKGVNKIRLPHNNLTVAKNGGKRPVKLREGVSPLDLPQQFQKISVDADKDALREYIENVGELDFAYLEERGEHLRII